MNGVSSILKILLAGGSLCVCLPGVADAQRQRGPVIQRDQPIAISPQEVRDPRVQLDRTQRFFPADGAHLVFAEFDADGLTVWRVMPDGSVTTQQHSFGPTRGPTGPQATIDVDGVDGFYYFWSHHDPAPFDINYRVAVTGDMAAGSTLSFIGNPGQRIFRWLTNENGEPLLAWHSAISGLVTTLRSNTDDFLSERRDHAARGTAVLVHRTWSALSAGAGIWQATSAASGSFAPFTATSDPFSAPADAPWITAAQGGEDAVEASAVNGIGAAGALIEGIEMPDIDALLDRCGETGAIEGLITSTFERYRDDTPDDPEEGDGEGSAADPVEAQAEALADRITSCFGSYEARWADYEPEAPGEADFVDAGGMVESAANEAESLATPVASQFESDFAFELNDLETDVAGEWAETAWTPEQDFTALLGELGLPEDWLQGGQAIGRGRGNPCEAPANLTLNVSGPFIYIGSAGNDHIVAGNNAISLDIIVAGPGDDCVEGRAGYDLVFGGAGRDEIDGGANSDLIFGGSQNDVIRGGGGQSLTVTVESVSLTIDLGDVIFGGAGNDRIDGVGAGFNPADASYFGYTDIVFGGEGHDVINGQGGIDVLFGQLGDDRLSNPGHGRIQSEVNGVTKTIEFGSVFFGNRGDDVITGGRSHDLAFGHIGIDRIELGDSADLAFGGRGGDEIDGQAGMDLIFGDGFAGRLFDDAADTLRGGPGIDLLFGQHDNDRLHANAGHGDLLFGNDGDDDTFGDGFTLHFGGPGRDVLEGGSGIDVMLGQGANDTLRGNVGPDVGFGGPGIDHLLGGNGLDLLSGDSGEDYLEGGFGIDLLIGGADSDYLAGQGEPDVLVGGDGDDCLNGGGGPDLMIGGGGDDCLLAGSDGSVMVGGDGADSAVGGTGSDLFLGNDGDDLARGDEGLDLLHGGNGDDRLKGEGGADILFAGSELTFTGGGVGNCLDGGAGTDIGFGGARADWILNVDLAFGLGGNDIIGHSRLIFGGPGNDRLSSGPLSGIILQFGGIGDDELDSGSPGLVLLEAGMGEDDIEKTGNGMGLVMGRSGPDDIEAAAGNNLIFGNIGNDTLTSYSDPDDARDIVFGNTGNDDLYGNSAAQSNRRDVLIGGIGSDERERDVSPPNWFALTGTPSVCTLQLTVRQPPTNAGAGR